MSQRTWTLLLALAVFIILSFVLILPGFSSLQQAEAAWTDGSFNAAAEFYGRAARVLFWRGDLWEKAGISAARGDDYRAAISYFEKAQPQTEDGWVWLATSHLLLGDVEASIQSCRDGLEMYDSASLYSLLAFAYHAQKDWVAEKEALENQLRLGDGDAYAHYRLGLLLALEISDRAYDELNRASALNPEVDSAAQTLISALNVSATQEHASQKHVTVGRALGLVQDWELALLAFERAVDLDEKNAEAWAWLGEAKQQLGQSGSVELDKALSLNRTSVNVRALRGLYWSRLGKYEQMLAEYLLAAEFEPDNPRWQASIGEAYARLGNASSALVAYQRAVELAPEDALYLRLLAVFCADSGVYVEEVGLPAAEQALALAPNDPPTMDALGFLYLSTGRYASAEQILIQAIGLAPDYYPAHLHLAMTYLSQGDRSAAYNTLTFVRDADTSGVYAEAANQLLQSYFP